MEVVGLEGEPHLADGGLRQEVRQPLDEEGRGLRAPGDATPTRSTVLYSWGGEAVETLKLYFYYFCF